MDRLPELLKEVLRQPLPGADFQYAMAPLHRERADPALWKSGARQGAVMLVIFPGDEPMFSLLRRPEGKGVHAGQVSLPGGSLEPGESYMAAAIRETYEETGLVLQPEHLLGSLTPLYIPPSNFYIEVFMAFYPGRPSWNPDPGEVKALLEIPVSYLENEGARIVKDLDVRGMRLKSVPGFACHGEFVWGATAMILSEFRETVRRSGYNTSP